MTIKNHKKVGFVKHINKLKAILKVHLNWHKSRIDCFAKMLLVLMTVQTVNLSKLANQIVSRSGVSVRYRRLQRFFSDFKINYDVVAKFLFQLFGFDGQSIYLTMDRTNWKWGQKSINILMLGIVYKGIAIPIYWILLNKQGNSNTRERIALMKRFIKVFGKSPIAGYLGDREFIGKDWFGWLLKEDIPFYIRIRNDALTGNHKGQAIEVSGLFHHLRPGGKQALKRKYVIYGHPVYLSGSRAPNGGLMIVASATKQSDAIRIYYKRWEIETLFQSFKTRGFHFEATHITQRCRIKKLMVLLAIGFCWAHKIGEWRMLNEKPIPIKKHGYHAKSIFRYGLDWLQDAISKTVLVMRPILKLIQLLTYPLDKDYPIQYLKKLPVFL
jgi:hypothetical protein